MTTRSALKSIHRRDEGERYWTLTPPSAEMMDWVPPLTPSMTTRPPMEREKTPSGSNTSGRGVCPAVADVSSVGVFVACAGVADESGSGVGASGLAQGRAAWATC